MAEGTTGAEFSSDESDEILEVSATREKSKLGASVYRSRFKQAWKRTYPFAEDVEGNPHAFFCSACKRVVNCSHMGKKDVDRHAQGDNHQKNARILRQQRTIAFTPTSSPLNEEVRLQRNKSIHIFWFTACT